ncbi:MAG: ankyrin repeat domain-containing protein [Magnetococcales bacterium]|nr:ankyrin repeat domain-containing protein [Magnetococcales bacterium]
MKRTHCRLAISLLVLVLVFLGSAGASADHFSYAVSILTKTGGEEYRAFLEAIDKHDDEALRTLLIKGNPNVSNDKGARPIHAAAYLGRVGALRLLIRRGAELEALAHGGWTPLHYAAFGGKVEAIRVLVAMGLPPDSVDVGGETPLFYAVEAGNLEAVKWLVGNGANINHNNNGGETPLSTALHYKSEPIADYLKSMGARLGAGAEEHLHEGEKAAH